MEVSYPNFAFDILARDPNSKARRGRIHTPHGVVETPNFIFCATKAALKGVTMEQARSAGAEFILANTYHLMLQPGEDIVAGAGGLQKMTGWNGPMLTDSGGFQIFSLGHGGVANEIKGKNRNATPKTLQKITEEGAKFRSYVDGSYHFLTPERSIQVQRKLGADLILVLDECTPFHSDRAYTASAMRRSHRWETRSLQEFVRTDDQSQALYGIVQGGIYEDLRKESCEYVANQPFFGQAVGGSLGGDKSQMHDVVSMTASMLHPDRPIHLLGIGGLSDIWHGVACGLDTFDCVHPTRLARHGGALVKPAEHGVEHLNLKSGRYRDDHSPLDPEGSSYAAQFSKSYIHHLFKANELLAGSLLTIHNINFMTRMARAIRESIETNSLEQERKKWVL